MRSRDRDGPPAAARGVAPPGPPSGPRSPSAQANAAPNAVPSAAPSPGQPLDASGKLRFGQPVESYEFKQNASVENFVCARSTAWSEAEVAQALPELRSLLPESLVSNQAGNGVGNDSAQFGNIQENAASVNAPSAPAVAKEMAGLSDKLEMFAPASNDWLVCELPKATDVNRWYDQIQTTQALTPVPWFRLQTADSPERMSAQAALKAENIALMDADSRDPAAEKVADKVADPAADSPSVTGKSNSDDKSAKASAETKSRDPAKPSDPPVPAGPIENTRGSAGFDRTLPPLDIRNQAQRAQTGRLILFVTEAEAKKILSTVAGSATENYWRVVPADASRGGKPQGLSEKKVIVIFNQTP